MFIFSKMFVNIQGNGDLVKNNLKSFSTFSSREKYWLKHIHKHGRDHSDRYYEHFYLY